MGRPRAFDSEKVMKSAMALFRHKGFEATSVRDLELATGLKAPSLYNAFGNKNALFATVLAHYRKVVVRRRTSTYLRPELGLSGLRAFFTSVYQREPAAGHGCMLTNTAVEFEHVDSAARRHVRTGLREIKSGIAAQLEHCQQSGELSESLDIDAATQTLLVLYQGILVLLRTGRPLVEFDTVVDTALAAIVSSPAATETSKRGANP